MQARARVCVCVCLLSISVANFIESLRRICGEQKQREDKAIAVSSSRIVSGRAKQTKKEK